MWPQEEPPAGLRRTPGGVALRAGLRPKARTSGQVNLTRRIPWLALAAVIQKWGRAWRRAPKKRKFDLCTVPIRRRRIGERRDWDDWTQEDSEPPQASLAHVLSGSCAGNKEEARHFMRKLDKHTARATARVEREAPESKDTATSLIETREGSLLNHISSE